MAIGIRNTTRQPLHRRHEDSHGSNASEPGSHTDERATKYTRRTADPASQNEEKTCREHAWTGGIQRRALKRDPRGVTTTPTTTITTTNDVIDITHTTLRRNEGVEHFLFGSSTLPFVLSEGCMYLYKSIQSALQPSVGVFGALFWGH